MTLKQIFIRNLKEFRKREGISQMNLAVNCEISPGYIGEIESGRKFPSPEMIEKIAHALKKEPYLFFKNSKNESFNDNKQLSSLPYKVKKQIKEKIKRQIKMQINTQINTRVNISLKRIFNEVNDILDNC